MQAFYGIEADSSMDPCFFCEIDRNNLTECGGLTTFGSLIKNFMNYNSLARKDEKSSTTLFMTLS